MDTLTATPTREELIDRAKALAPRLRARAEQAEKLRRVSDETIADLKSSQLARICQPSRYGGFDFGWDLLCECSMTLAHGDGSQAWVCGVFGEHACLVGHFSDEAQRDIWGNSPEALISSSYAPGCIAEIARDGYVLNGKWTFSSGLHHADWILLGALVPQPGGPPQHTFMLVPRAEAELIDDWHAVGMAGTGSCSFTLAKCFVPQYRTLSGKELNDGHPPGAKTNKAPVFRMPVVGYSHTQLCSVCVGVAEGLVGGFGEFLTERHKAHARFVALEGQQMRLAEAAAEVSAARLLLLTSARAFMSVLEAGRNLTECDALPIERDGTYAAVLAKQAAMRVFEATGGRSLSLSSPMQRQFRDVIAAGSHIALNWDRVALDYGRRVMGMPVQAIF